MQSVCFLFMTHTYEDYNIHKNNKMQKTALITGGAGFVGVNLSKFLLDKGYQVFCVDNLITGKIKNIIPLFDNKNFHFFKIDINHPAFEITFKKTPLHEIYHLACPTGVPNIKIMAEEMLLTNSTGTSNVLELARSHDARAVFTSSAEIYGQPEVTPQEEYYNGNVNPIGPRSPYEEGKRFSETLFRMYAEKYQVRAKIVRIFNTYGPGMSLEDQRVMPKFLKSIKNNEDIEIYGDGEQTRTFLYVDDLVNGIFLVMRKGVSGEAYNVGGDNQMKIKDLATLMKNMTNYQNGISFSPHFIEDHKHRQPATKKIRELGWNPKTQLVEGLKKMIFANGIKVDKLADIKI